MDKGEWLLLGGPLTIVNTGVTNLEEKGMRFSTCLFILLLFPASAFAQNPFDQIRRALEQVKKPNEQPAQRAPTEPAKADQAAPSSPATPATGQRAGPPWSSAATPGRPTCDEFLAFGADRTVSIEDIKRAFFGKPLAHYSQAELTDMRLQSCGGRQMISPSPEFDKLVRADQRIRQVQGVLPQVLAQAAQSGQPMDAASTRAGDPSCSDLVAYGAEGGKDYREQAKKAFFGRPLIEYPEEQINALGNRAFNCNGRTEDERKWLMFAKQKIDAVRDVRRGMEGERRQAEEKKQQDLAKAEQDKRNDVERQLLKSGQKKVGSIEDAVILHEPKDVSGIMISPLLRPDNGNYHGTILLEKEERKNVLLGRRQVSAQEQQSGLVALRAGAFTRAQYETMYVKPLYVVLNLSDKTTVFAPERLRIGAEVTVVGKYAANQKYKTVAGEERTAPILELMYLGAPK
jgi:hypothetical protein